MRLSSLALISSLLFASQARAASTEVAAPAFVDLRDYLAASRVIRPEHFDAATSQLEAEFEAACPQLFCRAGYPHVKPLSLRCSVARFSGLVQQCLWSFAASYEQLDPYTGGFQVFAKVFACPLAVEGTAEQLVSQLLSDATHDRLVDRPLTRYGATIDSAIRQCLLR